ncbi:MAG: M67 family metallopeptidase [Nitrospinae bacterium]|nr:M67 family metallopeptidase [Nitrospinota bacterium]
MILNNQDIDQIHRHAVRDYPNECCGIIVGPRDDSLSNKVYECINIQNRLHKEDPQRYPRDARTAYNIDPKEQKRIFRIAEEKGWEIKGFYHSHPDHPAYFSEEDERMGMWGDEPIYPNAVYIIVSVLNGEVKETILLKWNEEERRFIS